MVVDACILSLGLWVGCYFLGNDLQAVLGKIRAADSITVKGLAERPVKADLALWPIRFVAAGKDLAVLQARMEEDQKTVITFLKSQGLTDEEVVLGRVDVVDKMASEYRAEGPMDTRFIVYGNVMVRSGNVDAVQNISRKISDVVKAGVVFSAVGPG